jgi:hypothetical protein
MTVDPARGSANASNGLVTGASVRPRRSCWRVQYSQSIPFQRVRCSSLKAVDILSLSFQPSAHLGTWRQARALENRLAGSQYNKTRNGLNPESRSQSRMSLRIDLQH